MKVELVNWTPDPLAINLLLKTKNTRLGYLNDPSDWTEEQKKEHLAYMLTTIKSSWAFLDYTFEISGVTRAFTHQFVRTQEGEFITRSGEFAQESQRTVDVGEHEVVTPDSVTRAESLPIGDPLQEENDRKLQAWDEGVGSAMYAYRELVQLGMPVQDARGVLPVNISTSIMGKFSLENLHFMARTRLCVRTQGEYQRVFREMRRLVIEKHPWAAPFIQVECVTSGTCAFPRYGEKQCPIWDPRMDLTLLKEDTKKKFWASPVHVAIPVAKEGKTM